MPSPDFHDFVNKSKQGIDPAVRPTRDANTIFQLQPKYVYDKPITQQFQQRSVRYLRYLQFCALSTRQSLVSRDKDKATSVEVTPTQFIIEIGRVSIVPDSKNNPTHYDETPTRQSAVTIRKV